VLTRPGRDDFHDVLVFFSGCFGGDVEVVPTERVGARWFCQKTLWLIMIAGMIRKMLRVLAVALLLVALTWWLVTGANRGWTKTSVPVPRTDEVTGITVNDYRNKFVPGLDFLGTALIASGFLVCISFLCPKARVAGQKAENKLPKGDH